MGVLELLRRLASDPGQPENIRREAAEALKNYRELEGKKEPQDVH